MYGKIFLTIANGLKTRSIPIPRRSISYAVGVDKPLFEVIQKTEVKKKTLKLFLHGEAREASATGARDGEFPNAAIAPYIKAEDKLLATVADTAKTYWC